MDLRFYTYSSGKLLVTFKADLLAYILEYKNILTPQPANCI
jgi:hypothetical protein